MIRRLRLLFATIIVLFAPAVFALGLGELDLQSALNQQFKAEIRLTNLRGLQIDEVLPNLASQDDFDRVGVERNYILTNLRFKVVQDGSDLIVKVTSTKPIVEPFLDFIVEVLWPNGRILREYTVLLDPPIFGDSGVEAIAATETQARQPAPAQKQSNQGVPNQRHTPQQNQERTRVQASTPSADPRPSVVNQSPASQEGSVEDDEYGMTGAGDTLWTIALKVRPNSSVSVQQTMLALQRANPDAFINNNINLLKAGHVLRIPDVREIRAGSVASAVQEVRIQNEEFYVYKSGSLAQLDATRRQNNKASAEQSGVDGELKLLASNQSSGDRAGEGNSARAQELENNLAVAEEDLDRARRANTEMNVRLDDLQGQLETLNEILTLKDDQLAALRAELQKMQSATPATSSAAATTPPAEEGGLMSMIAAGIAAVVLVLGAGAALIFFRRRQQAKALDDDFEEEIVVELEEEEDLEPEAEAEESVEEEAEEEEVTQETNDVISEVEIYIAYGRFPQAITFLQNAIEADPQRADIQLKLLEVFVQTEDSTAFNLQLEQLKLLGDEESISAALALQQKIPGAAEDAAVSMDATIISSEPMIAIEEPLDDDDDDFSFDLDDLDSETEDDELDLSSELDLDDVELDLDLDDEEDTEPSLDLDLDSDDEISLDLDLDDDDEISLDLDLDLDDDDEISLDLDLDDDDEISLDLDLDGDDEISLDLDTDEEISLDLEGEDEISLDLDDDDEISLDLDGDNDLSLDLDLEGEDEISLDLDDDDEISLDLEGDAELSLDLDLEGEDEISLDLDDDEEFSLDLDDEGNKLDLARAYIDMGDGDGARSVLNDVLSGGSDEEIKEANALLEKID